MAVGSAALNCQLAIPGEVVVGRVNTPAKSALRQENPVILRRVTGFLFEYYPIFGGPIVVKKFVEFTVRSNNADMRAAIDVFQVAVFLEGQGYMEGKERVDTVLMVLKGSGLAYEVVLDFDDMDLDLNAAPN